ncbi:MAG: hypothetical protein ACK4GJ_03380 [bacterium]
MRYILEVNHDKSIDIVGYKGGLIKKSSFEDIAKVPLDYIKSKDFILLIPDSFLITKTLNISFDIGNILALKSFLMKSLPVNLNELYSDYVIFGNKMYFVAIKRENIEEVLNFVKKAKGKVIAVLPKSYAFKIAYNLNSPKYLAFNLDRFYTSVSCYEGNGYFFFVVLPSGFESKLEDELSITKFINELYRIVSSFQSQTKISIEQFFLFVEKEYKDLPVLSYLSKTFQGINFVTLDEGKYLEVYSKIIDRSSNFPINLLFDRISKESEKELLLEKLDKVANILALALITFGIFIFISNNDKLKKEEMILQALKNNYHSELNRFRHKENKEPLEQANFNNSLWKSFYILNDQSSFSQIYLENFSFKDNELTFSIISKTYSDVYFLNGKFKEEGLEANIDSNSKFSLEFGTEENQNFNKTLLKIKNQ